MSKDFEYDPETGSFRFDESGGKTKKKNDVDVGGWILIAALFAFGLWPIGLIALISKLSDKPKKVNSSRGGMRTSTSPNANVSSHSKVEKSVVKTAKQMNRAPKTSDKTARTLMIIGGIILMVPGVAFTNAIRDMVDSDYISGSVRMLDAVISFFCIAIGVGVVLALYGNIAGAPLLP